MVRCQYGVGTYVSIIWYDVVRHGMVWYDMVWYGMVQDGMVRYGTVWYGMDDTSCSTMSIQCRYGTVWYGMVRYLV